MDAVALLAPPRQLQQGLPSSPVFASRSPQHCCSSPRRDPRDGSRQVSFGWKQSFRERQDLLLCGWGRMRREREELLADPAPGFRALRQEHHNGMATGQSMVPLPSKQEVHPLPHLQDYIRDLPRCVNPLMHNRFFHCKEAFWLTDTDMVAQNVAIDICDPSSHTQTYFHRAGPRYHVAFAPEQVRSAIVTCGGLCPGLNTVIRELVDALWFQYGVRDIRGIRGGYRGFFSSSDTLALDPEVVDGWHKKGGTKLGTSRGGFDVVKIVDGIEKQGFNQIYIIGGDGTMRGAVKIFEEVKRRGLKVSVVGIPKTVDNDVGIIDRSFGFQTAVEAAQAAVNAAHTEAESTPNGVGLVKLMGRNAGHITVHAALGSRDVDCCLIPEVPFYMKGPGGLLEFVEQRLGENGHCLIVVAEGAGQDLLMNSSSNNTEKDMSGNPKLQDIGVWLGKQLREWWQCKHGGEELFACKYIDPTYMIRAVPSNAIDTSYCTLLAHSAIHGAMAGYTGFVAGPINGSFCYIPLELVASAQHPVDVNSHTWAWLKSVTNQPDFIRPDANIKYTAAEEIASIS